jgi:hypothetical protein
MKFVYIGESLAEPATLETSDDITNILNYLLNMERRDLQRQSVFTYRVWGEEFEIHLRGKPLFSIAYDIWIEFTRGSDLKHQQYHKYEFLVRRVK